MAAHSVADMTPPLTFRTWARDAAERAASTFVQALLVFLPLVLAGEWDEPGIRALAAALLPALGSVVLAALAVPFPAPSSWLVDVIGRTVRTFLVTAASLWAADGFDLFDGDAWKGLLISAAVAALAVVKGALARSKPNTITPASFATAA